MKTYYVYILECSDSRLYTGVTNNLDERIFQHSEGLDPKAYTFHRRPVKLVYADEFHHIDDAIAFEKQVKGWRREKKLALIRGDTDLLHELSSNYTDRKGEESRPSSSSG